MSHKASHLLIQNQKAISAKSQLLTYYEYTKPKIWYLLVFTSLTATFVATRVLSISFGPVGWLMTGIAIIAGTAGCNALTNYHDRDIDALMMRTRHRPLPSGRITPKAALTFGLGLISISLILAAVLNFFSLLWMALGILDNVGVYSLLLKRRSSLNILLGGFSGGLPVLFGWSAVTAGPVGSLPNPIFPLLMAGFVFFFFFVPLLFPCFFFRSGRFLSGVAIFSVGVGVPPS